MWGKKNSVRRMRARQNRSATIKHQIRCGQVQFSEHAKNLNHDTTTTRKMREARQKIFFFCSSALNAVEELIYLFCLRRAVTDEEAARI
jgi:hypothetical protein